MKNILQYILLISVLVMTSCKEEEVYEDLIPADTMADIIVDLHIAESIIEKYQAIKRDAKDRSNPAYAALFSEYNVSYAQFDSSLSYYQVNLDQYDLIYDKVIIELTKLDNGEEEVMLRKGLLPYLHPSDTISLDYQYDSSFFGPFYYRERDSISMDTFIEFTKKTLPRIQDSVPSE